MDKDKKNLIILGSVAAAIALLAGGFAIYKYTQKEETPKPEEAKASA